MQNLLTASRNFLSTVFTGLFSSFKEEKHQPDGEIVLFRLMVWTSAATFHKDFLSRAEVVAPGSHTLDKETYGDPRGTGRRTLIRSYKDGKEYLVGGFLWGNHDEYDGLPEIGAPVYQKVCTACGSPAWSPEYHRIFSNCDNCTKLRLDS